ncbi:Type II secretory pathway, pseudopilin PulG [Oleispira antarctica RB-8]|uniref:Type II secretory pathway, pseudopilin PulG n=1 Tax=Oleispira antarctica RB-8 TaxID=698738 RepID=R4YJV7_OLEAN|nr:Type II secretory pathway, pseudopilin PulG [Oleispira antarctica RB-8]
MRNINKQAGFTLIELIMVIVILGVLSAFALPRFADLGSEARAASISGLTGSLKAASNIAHAQSLAKGSAHNAVADLEGTDVTMIGFYPTADADGIDAAAQVDVTNDYTVSSAGGSALSDARTYQIAGAATPAACQVTYTAATAITGTASTVVAIITGC